MPPINALPKPVVALALSVMDQQLHAQAYAQPSDPVLALKLLAARGMLDGMARAIGKPTPQVWLLSDAAMPGGVADNAVAWGDRVYTTETFLRNLTPRQIADVLMHEAGHIYSGHSSLNGMLDAMDLDASGRRMREHVADSFVSVGDVALPGDAELPNLFRRWNQPESATHPSSHLRAATIEVTTAILEGIAAAWRRGGFGG